MIGRRWRAGAVAWALLALAAGARDDRRAAPLQTPTFRSGVELVVVNVSVVDPQQRFVSGLGVADFSVHENGVPREVTFFGAAGVPLDVGVLLDVSGSMAERFGLVAKAAIGFIRQLRPIDRAVVTGFADRVEVLQSVTSDARALERAVRRARPRGETALYDALYITAREIARKRNASDAIRRQALVVLTDGADTSSLIDRESALAAVRQSGVTVYTISPHRRYSVRYPRASLRRALEADEIVAALAEETGGRAYFLDNLAELPVAYAEIAAELFHQYTLAFETRHESGWRTAFRQLLVRVITRSDVMVRTRRGHEATRSARR